MISLDEAILHCQERAAADCSKCAREHLQLAEWLEELKSLRKKQVPMKVVYGDDNGKVRKCCNRCGSFPSPLAKYCKHCGQALSWS